MEGKCSRKLSEVLSTHSLPNTISSWKHIFFKNESNNRRNKGVCCLETLFKHGPHKTVKHTKTIHRPMPTNWLSVFDHFLGLELKEITRFRLIFNFCFSKVHQRNIELRIHACLCKIFEENHNRICKE